MGQNQPGWSSNPGKGKCVWLCGVLATAF